MADKSISVQEMGRLLGLHKTEAYRLANSGEFKIIEIKGHKRVLIDSFEEWYTQQAFYRKVLKDDQVIYYSIGDIAEKLSVSYTTAYDLTQKGFYQAEKYGTHWRINVESFDAWFQQQEDIQDEKRKWITIKEVAMIIGVGCADARAIVYDNANNIGYKKYKNGQIFVNTESFNQWYVEYLEELSYQENPWVLDAPKEDE